ncbi:hypothetical protein GPECTOR_2g1033 [Gonium pectorale]|uniref:Uncharacterized protein n=1 Tax=Gonium pectorale TaxID=33097 RepID=A0A150H0D0_GONPE|nr:hypothetical protein GPECTOR_2g1033 [Gonium pectorale]|eukprot:KXZ55484.1 hypothetical protein GPECTOR_2g1033 [Gonium pectorale]
MGDAGLAHLPAIVGSGYSRPSTSALPSPVPASAAAATHSSPSTVNGGASTASGGGGTTVPLPLLATGGHTEGPVVVTFAPPRVQPPTKPSGRNRRKAVAPAPPDPDPIADVPPETRSFLRGIRRMFGMDTNAAAAATAAAAAAARAAAAAAAAKAEEEARQEELPVVLPSPASIAMLTSKHQAEQDRMVRFRTNLLGDMKPRPGGLSVSVGGGADTPSSCGGGEVPTPATVSTPGAAAPEVKPVWDDRPGPRGKSFTQKALQDPSNPFFKSAMQLALAQEKEKTFAPDTNWREKLGDQVPMERPILMDAGWKI